MFSKSDRNAKTSSMGRSTSTAFPNSSTLSSRRSFRPRGYAPYATGAMQHGAFVEHAFPDVGRLCVIVPICTENRLHFSVRLDEGDPEVHFERAVGT